MKFYIYHIPNIKIGVTTNIYQRIKQNKLKYGDNIEVILLETIDGTVKDATVREAILSKKYGYRNHSRYEHTYNNSMKNMQSKSTREKQSESAKRVGGRNSTIEARLKNSKGVKETISRMSNKERESKYGGSAKAGTGLYDCTKGKSSKELLCIAEKKRETFKNNQNKDIINKRRGGHSRVVVQGKLYQSTGEARKNTGLSPKQVYSRLKNDNYPDYHWVD